LKQEFDGELLPVAFSSARFNSAELRYNVYEKEQLSIVRAFKTLRHYLEGARYEVDLPTKHKNLLGRQKMKVTRMRHWKWHKILNRVNYTLIQIARTKNKIANCISRPSNAIERDSLEPKKVIEHEVCCNAIDTTNVNSHKLKVKRETPELVSRYQDTLEGGHRRFKTTVEQIKKIQKRRNMETDEKIT
jgi:ribosomal protein S17E